jgi:hypothetical protein
MTESTHPSRVQGIVEEMEQRIVRLDDLARRMSRPNGSRPGTGEGASDEAPD